MPSPPRLREPPGTGGAALGGRAGVMLALSLPPWGWWPLGLVGAAVLYWRLGGLGLRDAPAGRMAGRRGVLRHRAGVGPRLQLVRRGRARAGRGALPRRRGRIHPRPAGPGARVRRGVHAGRGAPSHLAFRGAAARGRVPRAGGRTPGRAGPAGRSAGGDRRRLRRGRRPGHGRHDRAQGADERASPDPCSPVRPIILAGLLAAVVAGAAAPDGGAPVRTLRVALVQGGGQRGVSREDVAPVAVYQAQLAATSRVAGSQADLVVWPEDVVALDQPLAGSPQAETLSHVARRLRATLLVGVTEPATSDDLSQRGRGLGTRWPRRRVVREGAPGALRRVRARPVLLRALRQPRRRARGRRPGNGDRARAHAGRPARPDGVLRGLLRRTGRARRCAPARSSSSSRRTPRRTAPPRCRRRSSRRPGSRPSRPGATSCRRAPTGYTAVVTQRGVVVRRSVLGRRQVVTATVALRDGMTPYDRWGDLPVLVLAAGRARRGLAAPGAIVRRKSRLG